MLLKELQDLAVRYDIDITKDSAKKGKMIPKTKNELYSEIESTIKS